MKVVMKIRNFKKGFTLAELLITVGIIGLIAVVLGTFQGDVFFFNSVIQDDLTAQMDGRRAIRKMVSEIREASPSSLGSYPIAAAATSSVTFFSNVDNDILKEQVRYFIQNKNLMRGVIKPTGNPLSYNSGSETFETSVKNIANSTSTPLFEYYDTNYTGTTTPLVFPVSLTAVRLVNIELLIDRDPNRSPIPLNVTSQVSIRNLKDNL